MATCRALTSKNLHHSTSRHSKTANYCSCRGAKGTRCANFRCLVFLFQDVPRPLQEPVSPYSDFDPACILSPRFKQNDSVKQGVIRPFLLSPGNRRRRQSRKTRRRRGKRRKWNPSRKARRFAIAARCTRRSIRTSRAIAPNAG